MSDITAIVLSIGEGTTARAVESAGRQTLLPKDVIVIRNVSPFYKALNVGASKVTTEFFVQIDSDMILDETCLQDLRGCMAPGVGLAMGQLRDPLMGKVGWIKMFRRKCFDTVQYKDLISQDVVFRDDISQKGWLTVYAVKPSQQVPKALWHTFGEHRPSYTPDYTYSKYLVEGRRYRYSKTLDGLVWHLGQLAKSDHPMALIAQIALAHGIFIREETDLLKPYVKNPDFDFLEKFLASSAPYRLAGLRVLPALTLRPKRVFVCAYETGVALRRAGAFPAFHDEVQKLNQSHDPFAWIAKVALCHGLFGEPRVKSINEEYALLEDLVSAHSFSFILKRKFVYLLQRSWVRSSILAQLNRRRTSTFKRASTSCL